MQKQNIQESHHKYFQINCEEITNKFDLDLSVFESKNSFDLIIEFSIPIIAFRNHDYTWVDLNIDRIANSLSPKIIKLENGFFVQANINQGIWEINKKNPNKLFWRFNPDFSNPLTAYQNLNNKKIIVKANSDLKFIENPALLFSNINAIEISRSKIPFSAIACFTDHCDFDTLDLVIKQREFFKENSIKITKGFFLNHFSKRNDTISWQNESDELKKWMSDGHELAYHSLSQSIKSKGESSRDFDNFKPPFANIPVWIDHGYQPYNFSLFQKENFDEKYYGNKIKEKNIQILWNYIDSGTATSGVINQLNTEQFTLKYFWNGIKNKTFNKKIALVVKNTIIHFYNNEKLTQNYSQLATSYKKANKSKSIPLFFNFLKQIFKVALPLLKVLLFWKISKNKTYRLAKYSPIFFEHIIGKQKFVIFQTIELLDFKNGFNKDSINSLIKESGLFIGHTYFAVPMEYHDGRVFDKNGEINKEVAENFNYLGNKIRENFIWNPTLNELILYFNNSKKIQFDISIDGKIIVKNNTFLHSREILN